MHILITGAGGFVGQALAARLLRGHQDGSRRFDTLTLLDVGFPAAAPAMAPIRRLAGSPAASPTRAWLRAPSSSRWTRCSTSPAFPAARPSSSTGWRAT